MTNKVQEGDILTLTAPYDRLSGEGALVGSIFGVALYDVLSGARGVFEVRGVFDISKAIGSISEGAKVYWDNSNKNCTTTSSGNTLIGCAIQSSSGTTVRVRLAMVA